MLLVGEYRIEECDYLRVAVSWNRLGLRIQRIWFGRIIDTREWVVVHIV